MSAERLPNVVMAEGDNRDVCPLCGIHAEAALAEARQERDSKTRQISELVRTARSEQVRANNAEDERDALAAALREIAGMVEQEGRPFEGLTTTYHETNIEAPVAIARAALARVSPSTQGNPPA